VRVVVAGTQGGIASINTFWCKLTTSGSVTQADLDTWTDNFGAKYVADLLPHTNSRFILSTISSTYFVDGSATNVLQSTRTLSGTGTGTTVLEAGLAAVLSWLTSGYWRGGKPRTYLPGATGNISATAQSQWSSAFLTAMQTAAGTFRTDINGITGGTTITGTALGLVSFFSAGSPRVPPLFFAFTGVKIHPRVAHQRRRDGKWLN
jgi:hypothetical protein